MPPYDDIRAKPSISYTAVEVSACHDGQYHTMVCMGSNICLYLPCLVLTL